MKGPGKVLRELTQDVASLNENRHAFWALDPESGQFSRIEGSPKGTLGLLCGFSFLAGLAVGMWAAFPDIAAGLIACVAVGVLALFYYTCCVMRKVKDGSRENADEKTTPSGVGCRADQSVSFWDL